MKKKKIKLGIKGFKKMEEIKYTDEDIRKEKIEVNKYFKKEKFILDNLNNEKYDFYICETNQFFYVLYKKIEDKKFKEFKINGFYTFVKEYQLNYEKVKQLRKKIKNQKRR